MLSSASHPESASRRITEPKRAWPLGRRARSDLRGPSPRQLRPDADVQSAIDRGRSHVDREQGRGDRAQDIDCGQRRRGVQQDRALGGRGPEQVHGGGEEQPEHVDQLLQQRAVREGEEVQLRARGDGARGHRGQHEPAGDEGQEERGGLQEAGGEDQDADAVREQVRGAAEQDRQRAHQDGGQHPGLQRGVRGRRQVQVCARRGVRAGGDDRGGAAGEDPAELRGRVQHARDEGLHLQRDRGQENEPVN